MKKKNPPDTWFYGELTEPVKDVDALTKIMVEGIKRFKKYLEVSELEEVCENEELSSTIDLWISHDSDRDNYFENLLKKMSLMLSARELSHKLLKITEKKKKKKKTKKKRNNKYFLLTYQIRFHFLLLYYIVKYMVKIHPLFF